MGKHTAFFYGTLMVPQILYRVCYGTSKVDDNPIHKILAASLTIRPAVLHEYCRHKVAGCDYPGIIPEKGYTVRGTYVTGLTDGDIYRLDVFEGSEYDRLKVKVKILGEDGKTEIDEVTTETYVYTAGDEGLEEVEWDFEEFRREKIHRWYDTSSEYDELNDDAGENVSGPDPTGGRGVSAKQTNKKEEKMLDSAV